MTLRAYLSLMTAATLICWLAFVFIIFMVNPEVTNWIGFLLFYLSLFMALVGTGAVAGFLVRFVGLKRKLAFHSVREAFRQSFLFSFLVVAVLILLSQNLFGWLNLLLLIIGLSVLEFFLVGYSRPNYVSRVPDGEER